MCGPISRYSRILSEGIEGLVDWEIKPEDVEEFFKNMDRNETEQLVVVDEHSICCQKFIEFFENHFIPKWIVPVMLKEGTPPDDLTMDEWIKTAYDWVEKMASGNCHDEINTFSKMREDIKWRKHGKNSLKYWVDKRNINSTMWMLDEFEKCLAGDDFDFTDYVEQ